MIVVVDANILISDHLGEGVCKRVVDYLIENHTLALSEYILDETSRKFCGKFDMPPDVAARLAMEHRTDANVMMVVPVEVPPEDCPDPKDLPVLGTALAAVAAYLVTGDHHLLDLQQYRGIRIISPREFLELVAKGKVKP